MPTTSRITLRSVVAHYSGSFRCCHALRCLAATSNFIHEISMPLTKDQIAFAHSRFLEQNPDVQARVQGISARDAQILGVELEEMRVTEIGRGIERAAAFLGRDAYEFMVELAVDDVDERRRLLAENAAALRRALGL